MRTHSRGFWQGNVHEDLTQKEHGPGLAVKHQGVLATPTQTAAPCQLRLKYRGRVCKDPIAKRPQVLRDPLGKLLQPGAQYLVIIPATCIKRNHTPFWLL